MDLVLGAIPVTEKETINNYIRTACRELNRRGITSCHSDDCCVFRALPWQNVNEACLEPEAAKKCPEPVR